MQALAYAFLILGLVLGGCKNHSNSTTLVTEQPVTSRPIIAVVPVLDKSRHNLSWNISQELTQGLRKRLGQHNTLYLLGEDQVYAMTRKSAEGRDPFGSEITWVKKGFLHNEFVAFFELFEHRETPLKTSEVSQTAALEEYPAELTIGMRVRVFDLRGETAQVVLEEIVEQAHHIPQQFTRNQFNQVPWGDEMFEISPLGIAHEKICQEIAARVENYVLLVCRQNTSGKVKFSVH